MPRQPLLNVKQPTFVDNSLITCKTMTMARDLYDSVLNFKHQFWIHTLRHKPANSYTWYSNDQHTRKIIDLTISNQFLQRFCLDCRVRRSYDFHSDHRILITRFKTHKHRTMMKKSKYTKSKSKKFDFTNFTEEQIRTYKNVLSENLKKGINEISAEQLIQILQRSAEETLPRVNKTRHQPHPWDEDPQLKELLDARKNFHIKYDRRQYRNIQRKIRKRVTALRNEHFMNEARRFSNAKTNRKIAESYKIAKDQAKIYRKKPRQTACPGLLEHFQNHFNPDHSSKPEPTTLPQLHEPPIPHINDLPPTKEEVLKAIRQLRNNKASLDIPAELVKMSIECKDFADIVTKFYQQIQYSAKVFIPSTTRARGCVFTFDT